MDIPLDEVVYVEAIASSSTGAAVDADSTPTFSVMEEATDTDIGVGGNMTKRTSLTGDYRASFTASAANGFELGKWYAVIGSATVGGIACKGVLARFRIVAAEVVAGYPLADLAKWLGTAPLALSSQQVQAVVPVTQKVDVETIKTNPVVNAGTVTFPAGATLASTTNITAGTITTVTTLTNLPAITAGWLTAAGIAAGALNGKGDWSTYAGGDTSGTTTLLARLTAPRSGYLDNLNVGGNVASSAEVVAVQNNTRVVRVVPAVFERPDSGSTVFRVELLLYDAVGNMEVPDAAPTLAVVNESGTSRDANLDSTTMALVSTGRYRATYTVATAHALEQLVFTFSVVEGGATRLYGNTGLVVDTTAADFTATDRAKLDRLDGDYTTARAAKIDNLDTTISSRTKPADTQAAVTLVATTTNLTNAPTAGDFTATMKMSLNAATPASVVGNVGGIAGTTQTLDALQTALNSAHGAGSWTTAVNVTITDVSAATAAKIADVVLRRHMASVEASADGDVLDLSSLYGFVQSAQNSNTVDHVGFLTVYTTADVELAQLPLATNVSAIPITGMGDA